MTKISGSIGATPITKTDDSKSSETNTQVDTLPVVEKKLQKHSDDHRTYPSELTSLSERDASVLGDDSQKHMTGETKPSEKATEMNSHVMEGLPLALEPPFNPSTTGERQLQKHLSHIGFKGKVLTAFGKETPESRREYIEGHIDRALHGQYGCIVDRTKPWKICVHSTMYNETGKAGKFDGWGDLTALIDTYKIIRKEYPNAKITLVTEGEYDEKTMNIARRIAGSQLERGDEIRFLIKPESRGRGNSDLTGEEPEELVTAFKNADVSVAAPFSATRLEQLVPEYKTIQFQEVDTVHGSKAIAERRHEMGFIPTSAGVYFTDESVSDSDKLSDPMLAEITEERPYIFGYYSSHSRTNRMDAEVEAMLKFAPKEGDFTVVLNGKIQDYDVQELRRIAGKHNVGTLEVKLKDPSGAAASGYTSKTYWPTFFSRRKMTLINPYPLTRKDLLLLMKNSSQPYVGVAGPTSFSEAVSFGKVPVCLNHMEPERYSRALLPVINALAPGSNLKSLMSKNIYRDDIALDPNRDAKNFEQVRSNLMQHCNYADSVVDSVSKTLARTQKPELKKLEYETQLELAKPMEEGGVIDSDGNINQEALKVGLIAFQNKLRESVGVSVTPESSSNTKT